jgi:hypothetical protein
MDRKNAKVEKRVSERLDALTPESTPPVQVARARLDQMIAEKELNMWQRMFRQKYRPIWATLAVLTVLAISLTIPQIRAVATSFLGLFRVEQIEAVEVGISLDDLGTEMESHFMALDEMLADQIIVEDVADPVEVESLPAASAAAGFSVRTPTQLSNKAQRIMVQNETSVRLVIDRERWQAIMDSMGYDFEIPKSADGAEVVIQIPNAVVTGFGDCAVNEANEIAMEMDEQTKDLSDCAILMQSETPEIEAPPSIDINQAGQVMLQILGMSPEEAEAFSNRVDWATTLVVPVPRGADYRSVIVDGVEGVLLQDTYAGGNARFTLLWVKDGMFYALSGDGSQYSAVKIANSMK